MPDSEIQDLIEKKPGAADRFVRAFWEPAYRVAAGFFRNWADSGHLATGAADLALTKIVNAALAGTLTIATSERGYVCRTVLNECCEEADRIRAVRRAEEASRHKAAQVDLPDPAVSVEREECIAAVVRAVAALDEEKRNVVELVRLCGWSYGNAALYLDIPEGTVKSRLHAALLYLANDSKLAVHAGRTT